MRKVFYTLISIIIFCQFIRAQNLIANFPQLNAGGFVTSIVDDSLNNKIYIGGNFTSVNGSARKNIARLTYNQFLNTYTLDTWAPITSMTGQINCMAKYDNMLYIGGNYTSINGNSLLYYWSRINVTGTTFDAAFTPDDYNGTLNQITDMKIDGDRMYVCGNGFIYDTDDSVRQNLSVFSMPNLMPEEDPNTLNFSLGWGAMETTRLHISGNRLYLCGQNLGGPNDGIVAFDKNTMVMIPSFDPVFTFERTIDCESYNGKLYVVTSKIWPAGDEVLEVDESTNAVTTGAFVTTNNGTVQSIARYKNELFIAGGFQTFQNTSHNYLGSVDLNSTATPKQKANWNALPNAGFDNRYSISASRNRLFVSDNNLTNIAATAKTGMAAFCLEPYDTQILTTATANVCPSEIVNYSIQPVPYATGYSWWYSGTGVTIAGSPTANITLTFAENATSGTLYVSPYSKCNLYSDTLSFPITVHPRPHADAGLDTALNCTRLSIDLNGNSTSSPIIYQWNGPSGFTSSLSNPNAISDGEYILTVTNAATGCDQKDTMIIVQDTIRPNVTLPIGPFVLTCAEPSTELIGSSSTTPISSNWKKFNGGNYPNPAVVDSIGNYYLVITNTRNTCKDSNFVTVQENRTPPHLDLSSHSISNLIIDTLTCSHDSIWIVGYSDDPQTTFHWEDTASIISTGDSLLIVQNDAYSFFVTDTINGCTSSLNFLISEFITPPQIDLPNGSTDITCSNDTLVLDGSTINTNTALSWTGPNAFNSSDPATVNEIGYYVLTGIRSDNGCSASDSVLVSQIPLIEVDIGNDTLVCSNSIVNLEVSIIGNFASLNYSWSNGGIDSSQISVSTNVTEEFFVTVTDGTGCTGFDSMTVYIPDPISDSILTFASCDTTVGEIQIYASGGISPYSYSIDGINFQSQNNFIVPFGNYMITIMDSLGCLYTTNTSVNDNSLLPEPDFLVSTQSFIGDTLVLVNISNPQPDTLEWVFPLGTNIILNSVETPWIILEDTGSYQIILKGIYGNCESEKIKTIFVREDDSLVANHFNRNGIDTILIYPNPNNGIFDLEVSLFRKQDFSILIYDISGILQFSEFIAEEDYYSENIQLGNLQNGTYLIRVIAEFDARSIYFIIQH